MENFTLLGLDPGLMIGVAVLSKRGLFTFHLSHVKAVLDLPYTWACVEDYIPYKSQKFRVSGDDVKVIKQIGVIEYKMSSLLTLSRSKICATIAGVSNASKVQVKAALKNMGIDLKGKSNHEIDAISGVLTLGAILEKKGVTMPEMSIYSQIFRILIKRPSIIKFTGKIFTSS